MDDQSENGSDTKEKNKARTKKGGGFEYWSSVSEKGGYKLVNRIFPKKRQPTT